jgi:hypothetical protein
MIPPMPSQSENIEANSLTKKIRIENISRGFDNQVIAARTTLTCYNTFS